MKFLNIAFAVLLFLSSAIQAQNNSTKMDSASYAIGMLIAGSLQSQGITEVNAAKLAEGVADAMSGKSKMPTEQAQQLFQSYSAACASKKFAGAKEEGAKFLAENKKKPSVTTTASGLQYEVIKMGTGSKPGLTDKVATHYHGTLLDGKVFDSSVERKEAIEFPVNGVIAGWTEALQLMPIGSKFRLYIPYNLAYGERGAGGSIGPFAALIFDVELLGVNGKDAAGKDVVLKDADRK
jgi:FKBP-type peptidyl-prolyl cis-trans isomerase FklB